MSVSAETFLERVERELSDLPADERAELLEDLAAHFAEFADDNLVATLGQPEAYARELREAAGLSFRPYDAHVSLIDRLRANRDAIRRSAWWRAIAGFLRELRPAWWVVRAWLVVAAFAGGIDFPIPRVADNTLVGLIALAIVVPVSVMLGQLARRGERKGLNAALTVFGALFVVVLPASANESDNSSEAITAWPSTTRSIYAPPIAGLEVWAYDGAGTAYRVVQIRNTPGGSEVQALCPIDAFTTGRTMRLVNGATILCVGPMTDDARPPSTLAPSTTAPTTTSVPTTSIASTTASAPTTTVTNEASSVPR